MLMEFKISSGRDQFIYRESSQTERKWLFYGSLRELHGYEYSFLYPFGTRGYALGENIIVL